MGDLLTGGNAIKGDRLSFQEINVIKNCYYGPEPSTPATGLLWRSNVDEILKQWNGVGWTQIFTEADVIPVANGGTGLSTITDHGILLGSGVGNVTPMAAGALGGVVVGQGAADPAYEYLDRQNLLSNSGLSVGSQSTFENVSNQITVTDITNGVCTTADTEDLQVGDLVLFAGDGSVDGKDYEVTALVADTTFTIHDLTVNPGAIGGTTCFEKTPGFVAADDKAPDTWTKTSTLAIWHWFNHPTVTKGMYGVKCTKGVNGAEYLNAFGSIASKDYHYLKYRSRTDFPTVVTLGCFVYSVTAADNVKLQINDSNGTTESDFVIADTLTWVEITRTLGNNITSLTPRILFDGAAADEAYVSEPIFIRGSSIGEGNYSQSPGETIWIEADSKVLNSYDDATLSTGDDGVINLEAESNGIIPKGAKAVYLSIQGKDSGIADGIGYELRPSSGQQGLPLYPAVNNLKAYNAGWVPCDSNGDIYFLSNASGANTLSGVYIYIVGIQVS